MHSQVDNDNSTTGYVLWSTTPFFLKWLLYDKGAQPLRDGSEVSIIDLEDEKSDLKMYIPPLLNLSDKEINSNHITVIELGAGISGILPVLLSNFVNNYICTDQRGILNKLKHNIKENLLQLNRRKCVSASLGLSQDDPEDGEMRKVNLEVLPLDWETFKIPEQYPDLLRAKTISNIVYILAMDVIYNEYLIDPFLKTLKTLMQFFAEKAHCIVGIHLRDQDVVVQFLEKAMLEYQLSVYHVVDPTLQSSRFSLYYFC